MNQLIPSCELPQEAASISNAELKAGAFEQAAIGMALLDTQGHWVDVNETFCRMLRMEREQLLSRSYESLTVADDIALSQRYLRQLLQGQIEACTFEKRYQLADGDLIWVRIHASILKLSAFGPSYLVTQARDVTEERKTREALADSQSRLALALEGADLGMWLWEVSGGEFAFSEGARRLLDYRDNEVPQRPEAVMDLCHADDREPVSRAMLRHLKGESPMFDQVLRLRRSGGGYRWLLARGRVTRRSEARRAVQVSGTIMDVSKWKRLERRLTELATTDELTGLLNRRAGVAALDRELARSNADRHPFSMVLLDIDHFKSINDRFGHDCGDRVLAMVGAHLQADKRSADLAIRWGGEEFAVLLPMTDASGAMAQAERLFDTMAQVANQIPELDRLTASFGVVTRRPDEPATALMRRADALMYKAKANGRARIEAD